MKIAIQGYEGSFHHIVSHNYFGKEEVENLYCDTFREVATLVESGEADFGIMAIENSIAGSIIPNYSILQNRDIQVAGEAYLAIQQNLMVLPDTKLEDIEEVHTHPMAFLQCLEYLDQYKWKLVETEDTALSAKHIAERGLKNVAGIASSLAADLYGLKIVAPSINTIANNHTRFLIIKRHDHNIDPDSNKASLYFKTSHKHGALLEVLHQMEDSSINMTKLQSYPIPTDPWHYMFHVDMEFEFLDDYIRTLDKLQLTAEEVHVYGVYKREKKTE